MESLVSLWSFSNWAFVLIGTAVALYLYGTRNYAYFSKHKIPHNKPYPFVGTTGPVLLRRLSLPDYIQKLYNETKGHPYAVTFEFTRPIVMIRDPELIKAVTVKDFEHFTDHREIVSAEMEPLWGKGLFNLKGSFVPQHTTLILHT
jgi:cytochrome P450 family 9